MPKQANLDLALARQGLSQDHRVAQAAAAMFEEGRKLGAALLSPPLTQAEASRLVCGSTRGGKRRQLTEREEEAYAALDLDAEGWTPTKLFSALRRTQQALRAERARAGKRSYERTKANRK